MWAVIEEGTKIAKHYFQYGEEMGEAVRGRFVESVVSNARVRGHITRPNEIRTILHRCWVDEIRYRIGPSSKPKKYPRQDGATYELKDEFVFNEKHVNDGGIAEMEARIYLEQEAQVLSKRRGYREGELPAISVVAQTLAEQEGPETMQEVADRAGVSKASVSRACEELHRRLESS